MPGWGFVAFAAAITVLAIIGAVGISQQTTAEGQWSHPTSTTAEPSVRISAAEGRERPLALIVGDSYTAGIGASSSNKGWAKIVSDRLGWDATILSSPGGGYAKTGTNGRTIEQMIADADLADLSPDVIVIQSGYNDTSVHPEDTAKAIRDIRRLLAKAVPGVPVIIVGQFWPGEPTPASRAAADIIQASWAGREDTLLLDPISDGWSSFDTTDDRHPDDAGHALIAQRIIDAMETAGLV